MDLEPELGVAASQPDIMQDVPPANDALYVPELRPSEYTAALLRVLETRCAGRPMNRVLDVGVGSGVFLAALHRLGARELWGVDIEPAAADAARGMLLATAPEAQVQVLVGDMWEPIPADLAFDVIVANLPHFPAPLHVPGRPLHWSGGNGRETIDRFLCGLPARLAPGGRAFITHHELVGAAHTSDIARYLGLTISDVCRWTVFETRERMAAVPPQVLAANGASLRYYGGYAFVDARILEIRADNGAIST